MVVPEADPTLSEGLPLWNLSFLKLIDGIRPLASGPRFSQAVGFGDWLIGFVLWDAFQTSYVQKCTSTTQSVVLSPLLACTVTMTTL